MRNIHEFEVKNLLRMANDAKERAYVPYSGFRVGACLFANRLRRTRCNAARHI